MKSAKANPQGSILLFTDKASTRDVDIFFVQLYFLLASLSSRFKAWTMVTRGQSCKMTLSRSLGWVPRPQSAEIKAQVKEPSCHVGL